ncbi:hypothetical protein, partial [Staphylococcus hominis]|uniref:hypothetical protein n=1 Tax=Staphylococcus hominis TaxID=1290 RepID=UPI001C92D85D
HLHHIQFIKKSLDSFDEYYHSLTPFSLQFTQHLTPISKPPLITFPQESPKPQSLPISSPIALTQQHIATDTSTPISNLLLLTGNYRR